jgi:hypothetical protein
LASTGYYLKWMREEWLQDESAANLALLLYQPELMLRRLAPRFKKVEPHMEELF